MAAPFEDYPQVRRWMYNTYIAIGLGLGSFQAWFMATGTSFPTYFVGALSVYSFLGLALGFVAQANTPKTGDSK